MFEMEKSTLIRLQFGDVFFRDSPANHHRNMQVDLTSRSKGGNSFPETCENGKKQEVWRLLLRSLCGKMILIFLKFHDDFGEICGIGGYEYDGKWFLDELYWCHMTDFPPFLVNSRGISRILGKSWLVKYYYDSPSMVYMTSTPSFGCFVGKPTRHTTLLEPLDARLCYVDIKRGTINRSYIFPIPEYLFDVQQAGNRNLWEKTEPQNVGRNKSWWLQVFWKRLKKMI